MRWRSSFFPSPVNYAIVPPLLHYLVLFLATPCAGTGALAKVDLADSRLLDTVCPARNSSEIQAEYIRYPVCLETRWVVGTPPPSNTTETVVQSSSVPAEEPPAPSSTSNSGSTTDKPSETESTPETDADTDSPLDNANFLSFEEWKKQNLAKAGQSAENVGKQGGSDGAEKKRRGAHTDGIENALDGFGEDGEIELEFGGFVAENEDIRSWDRRGGRTREDSTSSKNVGDGEEHATRGTEGEVGSDDIQRRGGARRKDAGTTCKERFNYASFDCAATVLRTNPQCTGSSSVLIENKDSYMLNECRAKEKFLILELCDDILVDTLVLANYEFFSSIFRTFRVSVSDRYPAKPDGWKDLGTYEAANTREVQAFAVENPLIWARYLKIEFLTHYGNEFYCPVSLIRVHGTTMMEEYKNDGEAARAEAEEDVVAEGFASEPGVENNVENEKVDDVSISGAADTKISDFEQPHGGQGDYKNLTEISLPQRDHVEDLLLGIAAMDICPLQEISQVSQHRSDSQTDKNANEVSVTATAAANVTSTEKVSHADTVTPTSTVSETRPSSHDTRATPPSESQKPENDGSTETTKSATVTQQQPPSPNPTTQESFFKSVNKRLQMLETNSSLSLLYIEEQSRILRDAFNKVEKRQLAKTSNFLENLNTTVLHELREFRQQYDHVWHSVVIDFEQQRQQYHRELFDVSAQLGILADELVFQKRISIIQSVFVLICFGLVLFSRGAVGTYLELPRVQSFVSRSHSVRSTSPTYETPSGSQSPQQEHHSRHHRSSYAKSMIRHHHQRHPYEESHREDDDSVSISEPVIAYSAPTPPVSDIASTRSDVDDKLSMPQYPRSEVSTTSSAASPSVMLGPDTGLTMRQRSSPPSLGRADTDDDEGDQDEAVALKRP